MPAKSTEQTINIAKGGVVYVVNNSGSVILRQMSGQRQVVVRSTVYSDKVEVDAESVAGGKRVEIRTHTLASQGSGSSEESKVDYDITVPAGVPVIVSTATAPITLDKVSGDLSLSSDTGEITVRDARHSYVHVRSIAGSIVLMNVTGHVEVNSSNGSVQLTQVYGAKVTVGTMGGGIRYQGDLSGGGSYSLTTHSGTIDISLPETASIDLTARSVNGSVENDFPFQTQSHQTFAAAAGCDFSGTSNAGSSSLELKSFSGKIRIMKQ